MSETMFARVLKNIVFISGAIIIILLGIIPGDNFEGWVQIHPIIMAWIASFIIFQRGYFNIVSIILIAIYYISLSGVALSLGAASVVIMSFALRYSAQYYNQESLWIKWLTATAIFFIIELTRLVLLVLIFSSHETLSQIFINTLVFLIFLPIFHPIGRIFFQQSHTLSRT